MLIRKALFNSKFAGICFQKITIEYMAEIFAVNSSRCRFTDSNVGKMDVSEDGHFMPMDLDTTSTSDSQLNTHQRLLT